MEELNAPAIGLAKTTAIGTSNQPIIARIATKIARSFTQLL
jgi:hypothetical protein